MSPKGVEGFKEPEYPDAQKLVASSNFSKSDFQKSREDSKENRKLDEVAIKYSPKGENTPNPTTGPFEWRIIEWADSAKAAIEASMNSPDGVIIGKEQKEKISKEIDIATDELEKNLINIDANKLSPQEFQKKVTQIYADAIEQFTKIAETAHGLKHWVASTLDARTKAELLKKMADAFDTRFREDRAFAQRAGEKSKKTEIAQRTQESKEVQRADQKRAPEDLAKAGDFIWAVASK